MVNLVDALVEIIYRVDQRIVSHFASLYLSLCASHDFTFSKSRKLTKFPIEWVTLADICENGDFNSVTELYGIRNSLCRYRTTGDFLQRKHFGFLKLFIFSN